MTELLRCEICGATTERGRLFGDCGICGRPTCAQCCRVCDGCSRIFCMIDLSVKDVWTQGVVRRMKLCERCK